MVNKSWGYKYGTSCEDTVKCVTSPMRLSRIDGIKCACDGPVSLTNALATHHGVLFTCPNVRPCRSTMVKNKTYFILRYLTHLLCPKKKMGLPI